MRTSDYQWPVANRQYRRNQTSVNDEARTKAEEKTSVSALLWATGRWEKQRVAKEGKKERRRPAKQPSVALPDHLLSGLLD